MLLELLWIIDNPFEDFHNMISTIPPLQALPFPADRVTGVPDDWRKMEQCDWPTQLLNK